uniref:Uncharacterized protein MANES_01G027100 n=1 Tax=Rhizophora mucronata TaxID=61149 RepID=A0A2P2ML83_RHIMU
MENEAESSALGRPQVVGNAFVEQYYTALSEAPEQVHKFYQNISVISRPGSDNLLSSASTLDDIEKLILSQDYKNCVIEILTVDAQASTQGGVLVLVTGFFTGKENTKRKFTQIFFLALQEDLAPQSDAFFVLNDVFRYMEEETTNFECIEADSTAATAAVSPNIGTLYFPFPLLILILI